MKQVNFFLFWALISLVFFLSCKETSSELSLAGEWQFALDPADAGIGQEWQNKDLGDVVRLPGSLQEQGKGEDVSLDTRWTGQVVDKSGQALCRCSLVSEEGEYPLRLGEPTGYPLFGADTLGDDTLCGR